MALYYPAVRVYSSLQHHAHNSLENNVLRFQQFIVQNTRRVPQQKTLKLQATLANNSLMHYDYCKIQHQVITFQNNHSLHNIRTPTPTAAYNTRLQQSCFLSTAHKAMLQQSAGTFLQQPITTDYTSNHSTSLQHYRTPCYTVLEKQAYNSQEHQVSTFQKIRLTTI